MFGGGAAIRAAALCTVPGPPGRLTLLALLFALLSLRGSGVGQDRGYRRRPGMPHQRRVRARLFAQRPDIKRKGILRAADGSFDALPPAPVSGDRGVFFFVFGVNLLVARLAVALAVVYCAPLLYRLVEAMHHSDLLAWRTTVARFPSGTPNWWPPTSCRNPAMAFALPRSIAGMIQITDIRRAAPAICPPVCCRVDQASCRLSAGRPAALIRRHRPLALAFCPELLDFLGPVRAGGKSAGVAVRAVSPDRRARFPWRRKIWWVAYHSLAYYGRHSAAGCTDGRVCLPSPRRSADLARSARRVEANEN